MLLLLIVYLGDVLWGNMNIICSDLEGILIPEIWINVAKKTGIQELNLTTRDISDYDVLMKKRLLILRENGIKINDILEVIENMEPLEGALEFLKWAKSHMQIVIVSDTFTQFAKSFMKKLGWPTLFCNTLLVDQDGTISGYKLRQEDGKRKVANALKSLDYHIIAVGDSYNDISMLKSADKGFLFRPPENVKKEFDHFPVTENYGDLKKLIKECAAI